MHIINYEKMTLLEFSDFLLKKVEIDFYEVDKENNNIKKTMVGIITECSVGSRTIIIEKNQINDHVPFICKFLNESDNVEYHILVRNINKITILNSD